MACLSMKTWHAISEVVHDLYSINSANKLVEIVIPSSDFLQPLLPYKLGNAPEIKSIVFGKSNGIPLRQMDHNIRTQNHHYRQA